MVRPTWNQTNPLLTRKVTLEDIMKTRQKQKERVVDIMETRQKQKELEDEENFFSSSFSFKRSVFKR